MISAVQTYFTAQISPQVWVAIAALIVGIPGAVVGQRVDEEDETGVEKTGT
jgi:hypothetical protein